MPDKNISLTDKVDQLSRPEKMYFDTILKKSDENIFTTIKDLRKSQSDNSIEPQYKEAANLAMVAMTAHLNGEKSLPPQKTDDEALADIQDRIEQARLAGDHETYDLLRASLARGQEKAEQAEALQKERTANLAANELAYEEGQASRYETMLAEARDLEIQKARRMGMDHKEAEAFYAEWSENATELAVQRATGYTPPREPIKEEKLNIEDSTVHGAGTG